MILNCRFRSGGWWPRPPCPCQHHQPFAEDMHIRSKSTISHFHWWVATNLCWKIQPCGSSCARQGYVRKFWCETRNPWYTGTGSRTIEHIAQQTIIEIETRKYVCIESLWRALLREWEGVVSMHTGMRPQKRVRFGLHRLDISRQQREGLGHSAGARRRQPLKALMEALPSRCCHSVKSSEKSCHILAYLLQTLWHPLCRRQGQVDCALGHSRCSQRKVWAACLGMKNWT